MSHVIIGTAGHIDHGKTALVKALTDIDTDTLPEEQARGVTIDIGFAYWKDNVTIIDVPGHERFVKNMVTGVCTVDIGLLVVAADDGVMPQTREHLGILDLLGVQRGIVALNKIDLAERDWVELVTEDLRDTLRDSFLADAPIVPVSAATGEGVARLRELLEALVDQVTEREDRGIFRLPVDRAFIAQGFGTIVTGTVLSGEVRPRDTLQLLPAGRRVRVRGVQTHGRDVPSAGVGARAALNLSDVEVGDVRRGDILAPPGHFSATYMVDARLRQLHDAPGPMKNRDRVHLHLGPREVLARVVLLEGDRLDPGQSQLAQFRLEGPGVAARGDRFVVRRYSPVTTIGGGVVLDAQPAKHRRGRPEVLAALRALETDDLSEAAAVRLTLAGPQGRTAAELAQELGVDVASAGDAVGALAEAGRVIRSGEGEAARLVDRARWEDLLAAVRDALRAYHAAHPLQPGVQRERLRLQVKGRPESGPYQRAVDALIACGEVRRVDAVLALAHHQIALTPEQEAVRSAIRRALQAGGGAPPDLNELCEQVGSDASTVRDVVDAMQALGDLVRLDETLVFHPDVLSEIRSALEGYLRTNGRIEVSAFRDLAGTTRKYAVPLLNFFDASGLTARKGDVRVLVGRGR